MSSEASGPRGLLAALFGRTVDGCAISLVAKKALAKRMRIPPTLSALTLSVSLMGAAAAATPPRTFFNPLPAEADLVLPMPAGAEMVFRKVVVPGGAFWGDPKRLIQVGDGEGGIFEGLQRLLVSGTFPEPDSGERSYYLGKFEVSKGQFVAVMGMDRLVEATGDSEEKTELLERNGAGLERLLSEPLVFVTWSDMRELVHRYNLWLFDPDHPERLADMPRVGDSPGFLRFPTEVEWEFAARGGLPSIQDGSFKNSLPFPRGRIARHAWHLENARYQLRPIGLREPNRLGLHDMLGNAQEVCEGLFQPEQWQGQPGGLVARGGSVGTAARDLRSSRREEVEIYRWVKDEGEMREWRSYNTGIRLAIGANVVRSTANRRQLEKEYQSYRSTIRPTMPVGKTLDNPVAQASGQLTVAREELSEVLSDNEHLKTELLRVRGDIDRAQEQLDIALRTAAMATARDVLRGATDLARDWFKLASLRERLADAERLAERSKRYEDLPTAIKAEVEKRRHNIDEVFGRYTEDLRDLGELDRIQVEQALAELEDSRLTERARVALTVVRRHLEEYQTLRRTNDEAWQDNFAKTFQDLSD